MDNTETMEKSKKQKGKSKMDNPETIVKYIMDNTETIVKSKKQKRKSIMENPETIVKS